ncbi:hypothetical protein D1007_20272 [Hordeum vulgare]|nr:hypothetical protein D1007_20272 [Hordeum vulgare]
MQSSFPTFVQACSRLLMEEISANERERLDGRPEATPIALAVGHAPGGPSIDRGPSVERGSTDRGKIHAASPNDDRDRGGRRCGRGRGPAAGHGSPSPSHVAPSAGFFAPYGALLPSLQPAQPPWASPNVAGILWHRPPPVHQAYPVATAAAPPTHGPT